MVPDEGIDPSRPRRVQFYRLGGLLNHILRHIGCEPLESNQLSPPYEDGDLPFVLAAVTLKVL